MRTSQIGLIPSKNLFTSKCQAVPKHTHTSKLQWLCHTLCAWCFFQKPRCIPLMIQLYSLMFTRFTLSPRNPINWSTCGQKFSWSYSAVAWLQVSCLCPKNSAFCPAHQCVLMRKAVWVMLVSVVWLLKAKSSFNFSVSGKTCLSKYEELDIWTQGERERRGKTWKDGSRDMMTWRIKQVTTPKTW